MGQLKERLEKRSEECEAKKKELACLLEANKACEELLSQKVWK